MFLTNFELRYAAKRVYEQLARWLLLLTSLFTNSGARALNTELTHNRLMRLSEAKQKARSEASRQK